MLDYLYRCLITDCIRFHVVYIICIYAHIYTVKLVYNNTLGATKMCCYNQVVVVTRTFSTETIESIPAMCVVVKIEVDGVNSDFLTKFDVYIYMFIYA